MTLEAIAKRRSVREYKSDPVADEDLDEIIKAAQFAPTAHGNAAVEFVVIRHQATKDKLFEITTAQIRQEYVREVPVILVPVTDTRKAALPVQDLAVASENIFLEAAGRGLGTVWKNIYPEQVSQVKALLGIPENFTLVNVIPVGYPKEPPAPKSDRDFDRKKIHPEKW